MKISEKVSLIKRNGRTSIGLKPTIVFVPKKLRKPKHKEVFK
jgi:hypothetical protein